MKRFARIGGIRLFRPERADGCIGCVVDGTPFGMAERPQLRLRLVLCGFEIGDAFPGGLQVALVDELERVFHNRPEA